MVKCPICGNGQVVIRRYFNYQQTLNTKDTEEVNLVEENTERHPPEKIGYEDELAECNNCYVQFKTHRQNGKTLVYLNKPRLRHKKKIKKRR